MNRTTLSVLLILASFATLTTACSEDEKKEGTTSRPGCSDTGRSTSGSNTGGGGGGQTQAPAPPGEGGGDLPEDPGGGEGLRPMADPCNGSTSSGSGSGSGSQSGSSSSSGASYSFCLNGSGWTCPTADAKSACIKGNCGECSKDPSQCESSSSDSDSDSEE